MTPERWSDLVSTILDRFPVNRRGQEPVAEGPGTVEYVEFTAPTGEIRLEYTSRPVVIGKKTFGGRKIGTAAGVQYEYSPDEVGHQFKAWRKVGADWQEVDPSTFTA